MSNVDVETMQNLKEFVALWSEENKKIASQLELSWSTVIVTLWVLNQSTWSLWSVSLSRTVTIPTEEARWVIEVTIYAYVDNMEIG